MKQGAASRLTSERTLLEQHGAAAYRRGEPRTAPALLRPTQQWDWLAGYDRAAAGQGE